MVDKLYQLDCEALNSEQASVATSQGINIIKLILGTVGWDMQMNSVLREYDLKEVSGWYQVIKTHYAVIL